MMSNEKPKSTNKTAPIVLTIVGCAAIVGAGVSINYALKELKRQPEQKDVSREGPLVETVLTRTESLPVMIHTNGQVVPRVQINLVPEVSGKVTAVHPSMTVGGTFRTGDVLVTIDASDYELAVARAKAGVDQAHSAVGQARAQIATAETALQQEEAEAAISIEEWNQLNPGTTPPPLVARTPQVNAARAAVASAKAQLASAEAMVKSAFTTLADAELDLARTEVAAPFNGRVLSESVDIGQFVSTGMTLAHVYGSDEAKITVPLEQRQLRWLSLDPNGPAMTVRVTGSVNGNTHTWIGRAVRTAGEVDARSRMTDLIIEVKREDNADLPPLVPGMFVEVDLTGRTVDNVIRLPRRALHDGDTIWIYNEGKLNYRSVSVTHTDRESLWITTGLEPDERVIISPIDAHTEGMTIRFQATEQAVDTAVAAQEGVR